MKPTLGEGGSTTLEGSFSRCGERIDLGVDMCVGHVWHEPLDPSPYTPAALASRARPCLFATSGECPRGRLRVFPCQLAREVVLKSQR